jgi:hypothetical protein
LGEVFQSLNEYPEFENGTLKVEKAERSCGDELDWNVLVVSEPLSFSKNVTV